MFRHAEKVYSASSNPPLSERGLLQAKKIVDYVSNGQLPKPEVLLCSNKIRTQQTLLPLSHSLKIELKIMKELDERSSAENTEQFFQRIKSTLSWMNHQNNNICFATHFDWVEEALHAIPCETDLTQEKYRSWGSANFMNFTKQGEFWQLDQFSGVEL